jgi:hypothetical protein
MRILAFAWILGAGGSWVLADVSKEDVKALAKVGLSEDFLEKYIRANAPVTPLSTRDLDELREAKVGDKVLALLAKGIADDRGPLRGTLPAPPPEDGKKVPPLSRGLPRFLPFYSDYGNPFLKGNAWDRFLHPSPSYDYSLDPASGYAFPAYGFSYYPTMRYYAPSYSYYPSGPGFSYRSGY